MGTPDWDDFAKNGDGPIAERKAADRFRVQGEALAFVGHLDGDDVLHSFFLEQRV